MAMNERRGGKGFCPFCNSTFDTAVDICPNCGQDIRKYNDDLGPVLDRIQTATNIDMKSTKVRVTMSIIIFVLVFAGAMVIFDYWDSHRSSDEPEEPVIPEGIIVEVITNGYLDLTGDFAAGTMSVLPLYEPELKLQISIPQALESKYYKIMWVVETESFNRDNPKNPFYIKVTKERSGSSPIGVVTWENVNVGRFTVTANCYTDSGECDVYRGSGTYYGRYDTAYRWTYEGRDNSFDFSMSSDDVKTCLGYDLRERVESQTSSDPTQYVTESAAVASLNEKLMNLYKKNYRYTADGYADFILSFVQQCFPLAFDSISYKVDDYWAYPDETILWGCGDDEDRAILMCSLMMNTVAVTGESIDIALLMLPNTVIAGFGLDMTDSFIKNPKTVNFGDRKLTVADTGSDLGLGQIRSLYDVIDGKMYYNGALVEGDYIHQVGKKSNI